MNQRRLLRELLGSNRPLIVPDAFDGLSARLIQEAGFKAVQCSGLSMALASGAVREEGLSLERNLEITRAIVRAVDVPVMADGEDGYGPPATVYSTVAAFVEAGVSSINVEDQVLPPATQKAVIDPALMIEKLRAAREAAAHGQAPDLVINARTDALAASTDRAQGIAESIERGNRYLDAGADMVFVTAVRTPDEARQLTAGIRGPVSIAAGLPYNLTSLTIAALRDAGVARVSLPVVAVYSALKAMKKTLALIHESSSLEEVVAKELLCSQEDVNRLYPRAKP